MSVKLEKLQPNMTVYEVGRRKMGNTTMTTVAVWPVTIKEVNMADRCVVASWNGNPARIYHERQISKWRAQKPTLIHNPISGRARLATREERKQDARKQQP